MSDGSGPDGSAALARAYYRAIDDGHYERLAAVLAPDFVHHRPDRTLDGRERFVRFMREERPLTDTSHPIDEVFVREAEGDAGTTASVAVRGRLCRADGSEIVAFVDVFEVADGRLQSLQTYTH